MASYLFTSESVTEGHPDKICDQISDAVLDAVFAVDPNGRVACETAISTGLILVMGQITTSGCVDIPKIARIKYPEGSHYSPHRHRESYTFRRGSPAWHICRHDI